MDSRDSSELQLLEVARGVRKLTQMIDSWSRAPNIDVRSKYIAKDLLRDSLALQESLITIRRLQETSRMMSFMEQKHELGFIKERLIDEEDNSVEEFDSLRFGVGVYDDIIHSLSTSVSSRNRVNEINSDIIEKLKKQNHVSILSSHDISLSNWFSEFPSNISSFNLTENSKCMTDLTMRAKAPNLIANLMGLEKIPSQVVQSVKKEQKSEKNIHKQSLDCENLTIQSRFTSDVRRSHVNRSEGSTIVIMKPLLARGNEGEKQKIKENMPAELSLKKEISCDQHMLKRKQAVKRMDKVSVELFPKFRTPASVTHKLQRKEPMAIGVNKGSILNGKAAEDRRDVQFNSVPLTQTKRIKEPPAKPDKKPATTTNGRAQAVCNQSSTSIKNILTTNAKTMPKHSTTYLMEQKKKGENMSGRSKNIKTVNTKCKGVGKRTKPSNKASDFCRSFSTLSIHGFPHRLSEDSKHGYGENIRMGSKSFCEVMPKGSKGGKDLSFIMSPHDKAITLKQAALPQKDIKLLLLNSPEFLAQAEELFGFDVRIYRSRSYQNVSFEEFGGRSPYELLLGCAMELMARKSDQLELLNHPMWGSYQQSSQLLISLEQLVEEISDSIKELNGYYRTAELKGNLYLRLERDLRYKNMFLSASWDFGWISRVCVKEFGAVVEQIESHIICGIVGEVAFDLLP